MNKCLKIVCIMLLVSSCTTDITSYRESQPKFDIKQYFDGNIIAWGMVQDYSDKVTRRFCVEIIGTWQGNEGTLAETFYFNDGEISYRNWQLSKQLDGSYQGTAEDVVGRAIGKHQGFAFQLEYELLLKLEDDTYQVQMDDWMYLLNEHQVMNKTSMSKFGVKVADITLFFDKNASKTSCNSTL